MPRDYDAMRAVLATAARGDRPSKYGDLWSAVRDESVLRSELARLGRDGLLDNGIRFHGGGGCCLGGEASITEEGREFLNLIENEGVWQLVLRTLTSAGVDVPYPLLKEVCEEIVKRYVSSFIPDIP